MEMEESSLIKTEVDISIVPSISKSEISSICRACLANLSEEKFDVYGSETEASKFWETLTLEGERELDKLPKFICVRCYNKLNELIEFRNMCLESLGTILRILEDKPALKEEVCPLESELVVVDENFELIEESEEVDFDCKNELEMDSNESDEDFDDEEEEEEDEEKCSLQGETANSKSMTFSCPKCPKKCSKQNLLDAHLRIHDGLRPYPCSKCDKSYIKQSHLNTHLATVHSEKEEIFTCSAEGCGKTFRRCATYRQHVRLKHAEVPPEPKLFVCEDCGKTFKNMSTFKNHQYKHNGQELPYQCNLCSKKYVSQRTYKEHLLRHAGIKNFICPYCGMRKTTKGELRTHINYHTKEKQWPCGSCSQVFNSSANLGLHTRVVHKGIRKYACKYCDLSFGKAETLKHHEMRHTGEKPHACDVCGKRFIQVVALRAHLKTHNK